VLQRTRREPFRLTSIDPRILATVSTGSLVFTTIIPPLPYPTELHPVAQRHRGFLLPESRRPARNRSEISHNPSHRPGRRHRITVPIMDIMAPVAERPAVWRSERLGALSPRGRGKRLAIPRYVRGCQPNRRDESVNRAASKRPFFPSRRSLCSPGQRTPAEGGPMPADPAAPRRRTRPGPVPKPRSLTGSKPRSLTGSRTHAA
jgi:hypothetical protein